MTRIPHLAAALTLAAVLAACGQPQPAPEAAPPHDTFTLDSRHTADTRTVNVYLPPAYAVDDTTAFPVLYMPDGGLAEDFPHIANTVDTAIRAGQMRPLVLVGIGNTQRRRDMTGPTEVETDRKVAPVVGGSASFRAFIADELIPEVQRRYRVTDEAGIVGESLAGWFIVETFFLQPELFDVYVALSPSLWWNADELVRKAPGRLDARPGLVATLYLSSADETDIAPQTARLAEALQAHAPAGLRWLYEPRPDLQHGTIYRAVSPDVLRRMFPPVGAGT